MDLIYRLPVPLPSSLSRARDPDDCIVRRTTVHAGMRDHIAPPPLSPPI